MMGLNMFGWRVCRACGRGLLRLGLEGVSGISFEWCLNWDLSADFVQNHSLVPVGVSVCHSPNDHSLIFNPRSPHSTCSSPSTLHHPPSPRTHPTGWLIGHEKLIAATLAAHSRLVFSTNSPLQEAVAIGLEKAPEHNFFASQLEAYRERRDILCSYFDQLGLSYTKPEGSYFLLVDMSPVKVPDSFEVPAFLTNGDRGKDFITCWWMTQEIGVVGIPPSEVSWLRGVGVRGVRGVRGGL